MSIEIAGMTYTRAPEAGETIKVRMQECGNFITTKVWANGDLIAFDNMPKPDKPCREDAARRKRERLAEKATDHWEARGFTVDR
ncbi:MAG TPA: hypothetical protein PKE59_00130 [Novosphingobium sp.]|jgi:hypothetical protein|nr:hypothetical protein [Novosphingobium sp.]